MPELMTYELLLRRAFGNYLGSGMTQRWGDPAALADAGYINTSSKALFARAKSAVVYAMSIIAHRIEEKHGSLGKQDDLFDELILKVFNARKPMTIINTIREFQEKIEFKAFPPKTK